MSAHMLVMKLNLIVKIKKYEDFLASLENSSIFVKAYFDFRFEIFSKFSTK